MTDRKKERADLIRLRLRLAHLRIAHGIRTGDICESMDIDPTFLSHVLHGRRTSRPLIRAIEKQIRFYHHGKK